MLIYFAPMEGITDAIFRQRYHACFGGVDQYFMPFVSPSASFSFTAREEYDISPAANRGLPVIPQILAKEPEYFLGMARIFRDMGYGAVNLNLGCPSGTVTGKVKGSAMLRDVDALQRFLDALYIAPPLPVSIKTRIGFEDPGEWAALLPVFARYPVQQLIIHPRTRREQYRGVPHREMLAEAIDRLPFPVIYNGDVFAPEELTAMERQFPQLSGVMVGRGMLANPALLREYRGGAPLQMEDITRFHDDLLRAYLKTWPEGAAVGKMHIFLKYFCHCLDYPARPFREAMKANKLSEYQDAVGDLFGAAALKAQPRFSQE